MGSPKVGSVAKLSKFETPMTPKSTTNRPRHRHHESLGHHHHRLPSDSPKMAFDFVDEGGHGDSAGMRTAAKYGFVRDRIKKGEFFGEKGLKKANSRRGATIIADVDCELFVVDKKDFDRVREKYDSHKE